MSKRKKPRSDPVNKKYCKKTCKPNPDISGLERDNPPGLVVPSSPTVRRSTRKSSSQYARRNDDGEERNSCLSLQNSKTVSRPESKKSAASLSDEPLSGKSTVYDKSLTFERKDKRKLTSTDSKPVTPNSNVTKDVSFPRCYNIRTRNKNDRQLTQNSRKSKCVSKDACEILTSTESDLQEDEIKTDVISQCDTILVGGGIRKRGKKSGGKNSDISQWTSSDDIMGKQKHVKSEGLGVPRVGISTGLTVQHSLVDDGQDKYVDLAEKESILKSDCQGSAFSVSCKKQKDSCSLQKTRFSSLLQDVTQFSSHPNPAGEICTQRSDLDTGPQPTSYQCQNVSHQSATNTVKGSDDASSKRRDDTKKDYATFDQCEDGNSSKDVSPSKQVSTSNLKSSTLETTNVCTRTDLSSLQSDHELELSSLQSNHELELSSLQSNYELEILTTTEYEQTIKEKDMQTKINTTGEIPDLSKANLKWNVDSAESVKTDKVFCHVSALLDNDLVKFPQVNNFIQNELPRATGIRCVTSPDHVTINGSFLAVSQAWHILHKMKKVMPNNALVHINVEHQQDHDYDQSTKSLKVMWTEPNGKSHELPTENVSKGMYVVTKPKTTSVPSQPTSKSNLTPLGRFKKSSQVTKGGNSVEDDQMKNKNLSQCKAENHSLPDHVNQIVKNDMSQSKGENYGFSDPDNKTVENNICGFKGNNSDIQNHDASKTNSDEFPVHSEMVFSISDQSKNLSFDQTEEVLKDENQTECWTEVVEGHNDNVVLTDEKILDSGQHQEVFQLNESKHSTCEGESRSGLDHNSLENGTNVGKEKLVVITGPFGDKQCILLTVDESGVEGDASKSEVHQTERNSVLYCESEDTESDLDANHKPGDISSFQNLNTKNKPPVHGLEMLQSAYPDETTTVVTMETVKDYRNDQDTNNSTMYSEVESASPNLLEVGSHNVSSEVGQNISTSQVVQNCQMFLETGWQNSRVSEMDNPIPSGVTQHIPTASQVSHGNQSLLNIGQHDTTILEGAQQSISVSSSFVGQNIPVSLQMSRNIPRSSEVGRNVPSSGMMFKCNRCSAAFTELAKLKRHKHDNHTTEKHQCGTCGKTFSEKRYLHAHLNRHFGMKKHACSVCGWKFFERHKLQLHLETHKSLDKRRLPYRCLICLHQFHNRATWSDHLNTHTGAKPFSCSVCQATFAHRIGLKRHHLVHEKETPFKCNFCGKGFKLKTKLQEHLTVHTGKGRHVCHVCSKVFTASTSLKRHMYTAHGENSSILMSETSLKQQVFTTNEGNDSSSPGKDTLYMCWKCGSMFQTPNDMEEHASTHCQTQVKLEVIETSNGDQSHPVAMDTTLVIHQTEQPEESDSDAQLQSLLSTLQNPEGGNSAGLGADNSTLDEVEQMKLAASTLADLYSYAHEIKKEKE